MDYPPDAADHPAGFVTVATGRTTYWIIFTGDHADELG
jgi:hypothetical protein